MDQPTQPNTRKPTKKAFHFPKSAEGEIVESNEGVAPAKAAAEAKAAKAPKAAKAEKAAKVVKPKAAAKQKAVSEKPKAAPTKTNAAPTKTKAASAKPKAAAAETKAASDKPKAAPAKTKATSEKSKAARSKGAVLAAGDASKEVAEQKPKRAKKEKVVRDSFTMPKSDYAKIAALKQKCLEAGVSVKKGELLRAGLLLLESASSQRLLAAVAAVEAVKTGRPAKATLQDEAH